MVDVIKDIREGGLVIDVSGYEIQVRLSPVGTMSISINGNWINLGYSYKDNKKHLLKLLNGKIDEDIIRKLMDVASIYTVDYSGIFCKILRGEEPPKNSKIEAYWKAKKMNIKFKSVPVILQILPGSHAPIAYVSMYKRDGKYLILLHYHFYINSPEDLFTTFADFLIIGDGKVRYGTTRFFPNILCIMEFIKSGKFRENKKFSRIDIKWWVEILKTIGMDDLANQLIVKCALDPGCW